MAYVRNAVRTVPRFPTEKERDKILKLAGDHVAGFRDHVMLSIAFRMGLRELEIRGLDVGDVMKGGKARGRVYLQQYKGRGQTKAPDDEQNLFVPRIVRRTLEKYMLWKKRRGEPIGPAEPLFISNRGDRIAIRTIRHIGNLWQRRAGIDRPYTFHAFRHACLTELYRRTKDLLLVKRHARHKDARSTEIYARATDEDVRRAVEDL